MKWFSRKGKDDQAEIETADDLGADFDQQWGESQRNAKESRRKGSHYYREQAKVDRAGTPKPSHRQERGWRF